MKEVKMCSICSGAALLDQWGHWGKSTHGGTVCNGCMGKLDVCGYCNRALVGEEAENPSRDEAGNIICNQCYEEYYQFHCAICEECEENSVPYYSALSKEYADNYDYEEVPGIYTGHLDELVKEIDFLERWDFCDRICLACFQEYIHPLKTKIVKFIKKYYYRVKYWKIYRRNRKKWATEN